MMNLRKKSKKTILSSLIALALSSSMAFAMPQGGTVVAGNVNDVTSGSLADLASGGTLNVNALSLIDWKSFNIGQGEILNVIFNGGSHGNMLINHVTGGDVSRLMGILNSGTNGSFWLINPAGIVVGKDAQFNVGGLVLSTLDVSNNDLMGLMVSGGDPTLKWEKTKEGVLDIQGGKFKVTDMLSLVGGKIQIADGVTISAGDTDSTSIIAANSFEMAEKNGKTNIINCNMDENNVLSFNNAHVNVTGGALSAMAGKINFANSTVSVKDGAFRLAAVNKLKKWDTEDFSLEGLEANRKNSIKLDNSTVEAAYKVKPGQDENKLDKGRLFMAGAVVELNNNSTVKADDRIEISTALPSAFEKNSATFKPEEGSEVILRDSAISGGDVAVVSNKISLLGNSRVTIGNDGRFLAMGAGSSVQMVSGGSKNDKDTFTEAKGNGKIAISKATYDNLLKAGVMPFIKDYVIVSDTVVDKSTVDKKDTVAEYKDIVNNDRLTEAQKVEKIKEVLSGNENAVALATAVQGHVDNAITAAPQTSTAIPAATSVESTNVAAGEGVMSSDESAVKGVDEKKK